MLVKITFDLEFALPYTGGFVPVHLSSANNSVWQFDFGYSLRFLQRALP